MHKMKEGRHHMSRNKTAFIGILTVIIYLISGCGQDSPQEPPLEESPLSVNEFSDASISIIESSLTADGISVDIVYTGNDDACLSSHFYLEIFQNDKWYTLPTICDSYVFNDLAYPIGTMDYNWHKLYGTLSPGTYRIITSILIRSESGKYEEHLLAAPFTITSNCVVHFSMLYVTDRLLSIRDAGNNHEKENYFSGISHFSLDFIGVYSDSI